MPIALPLIALGAAYAVTQRTPSEVSADEHIADVASTDGIIPDPETDGNVNIDWTSWIERFRGDAPADYLARWIKMESDGNPCAKGAWGGPWEAGIGQVYFDVDERHKVNFGVTLDALRSACALDGTHIMRQLTDDEMTAQVSSLSAMVNSYIGVAKARLAGIGEIWSDEDTLCLAKLYHALPVFVTTHLSYAHRNGATGSWDEYRAYYAAMTRDELVAVDAELGYKPGKGAYHYYPTDRLFANGELAGRG